MAHDVATQETGKILRGCRAFWLSFDEEKWTCLGADDDSLSIETNPDTENNKNVQGRNTFVHNGYKPTLSNDNYYARREDSIYPHLQNIADTLTTDENKTTATLLVATLTDEVYKADTETLTGKGFKAKAIVVVNSDGGGTAGYQIPYTVTEIGGRTPVTVSVSEGQPTYTVIESESEVSTASVQKQTAKATGGSDGGSLSE